jgi:hypothetical protein
MDTGMSNSSGVAGAFGKNESLESCGFCSESFFNKVEPMFAIPTLTSCPACSGCCAMTVIECYHFSCQEDVAIDLPSTLPLVPYG